MISLPQQAQDIIDTLKKAGFAAYAVGGSVRDLLMKRPTSGWDFATSAKPEEILSIFADSFYDNQFGTVGVKVGDDIYEVTTFRSEGKYSDRRHPDEVSWGKTIEEDLARRDFTINAIAYDGKKLIDPYDGQADIKAMTVKAVGNPSDRFAEDALRMMRAVRIASELGFMIEPTTLAAIAQNAQTIMSISAERIRDELLRLMKALHAADGVILLKQSKLLSIILPELEASFSTQQKSPKRHHIFDVGTHLVMSLKHCPSQDPITRLATLLHDIGKPATFRVSDAGTITFYNHEVVGTKMARGIAKRLRLSKKESEKLLTLIRWHQFSVDERQTDAALRRFIRRVGKDNLGEMLALRIGDRLGGGARETSWRLELFKKRLEEVQVQPFSVSDLAVDGFDVMKEYDTKPGPIVGKVLSQLFSEVEEGKLKNERDQLLLRLRELKNSKTGVATKGEE